MKPVATYSIAAVDGETKEVGIAVQSRFLAVGAVVPWLEAGTGAVATQAWANTRYGPEGLKFLKDGMSPARTIEVLTDADEGRNRRQVGIVHADGRAAAYTGCDCSDWAGHVTGEGFTCQGNILTGASVVHNMADAFCAAKGDLAHRMLDALDAAQAAGGDSRGMQSAALVVVKPNGGYGGFNDRYLDLRVDDHTQPLHELRRLLFIHHLYFHPTDPHQMIQLEPPIIENLQQILTESGMYVGQIHGTMDEETTESLMRYMHRENFEERIVEGPWIDGEVYRYMMENNNAFKKESR